MLFIDRVDISTNGRIVPSIMCNGSNPIVLGSEEFSASILRCQYRRSLHRIKLHTSNKANSGTDYTIILDLRIMKKNGIENELLEECKGLLLDNYKTDRARGTIEHYFNKEFGELEWYVKKMHF